MNSLYDMASPELSTAVLIHQLPAALKKRAIAILKTDEAISRSVTYTKEADIGLEVYLESQKALEKAVLFRSVTIFNTVYKIYPLVTDLTVHGARAHLGADELKRRMQLVLKVKVLIIYEEKECPDNYRVTISHPEIPEEVQEWTACSDRIFKDTGFKFPITFFCRFCRNHGHPRSNCDRVVLKLSVEQTLDSESWSDQFTPSPSSSSREYNFQAIKTLPRNSNNVREQGLISIMECDSRSPPLYQKPKKISPVNEEMILKRKLDSRFINQAKRERKLLNKNRELKEVDSEVSHVGEVPGLLDFAIKTDKASNVEDFSRKERINAPGCIKTNRTKGKETAYWIPMENTVSLGRKSLDSTTTQSATEEELSTDEDLNQEEKANHLENIRLNLHNGRYFTPSSGKSDDFQQNSYPALSLSKNMNESSRKYVGSEVQKNFIKGVKYQSRQEKSIKTVRRPSCQETSTKEIHQEYTIEKCCTEKVGLEPKKSCNSKFCNEQTDETTQLNSDQKFQRRNSMSSNPVNNKDVYGRNPSSQGAGNAGKCVSSKRARKNNNYPITSEILIKIIENSNGELNQTALKGFFAQVSNRKNPLKVALVYSNNVPRIIQQLKCVITAYYDGPHRESKANRDVGWIRRLIDRMEARMNLDPC